MKDHLSGVRHFEAGDDAQDRGLAAAGCAEQNQHLAFTHIKADVFQDAGLPEALANADHTRGGPRWICDGSPDVWLSSVFPSLSPLINVKPIAREKENAEDEERKQSQHDRDCVGGLDLAFVELREDVEGRGLRASGEVSGHEDRRTKFADRAREGEQCARNDRPTQRRQRDVPERLPTGCADGSRGFFKRATHRVEDRFDHAESKRESNEDIREDNRAGRKHDLNTMRREQTAERTVGPQSSSNAKPATAVGIAVGREMVTMSALRPQKL